MTFEDELIQLRDSGLLTEMYRRGLVSYKIIYYLDIYRDKTNKGLTYQALAKRLGISKRTVYLAVASIKE